MAVLYNKGVFTIIEVPVSDFKIKWFDKPKKEGKGNFVNGNFFGKYDDSEFSGGENIEFTLPAGNLICDVDYSSLNLSERHYLLDRGIYLTNDNSKWMFTSYDWAYDNKLYQRLTTNFL